MHSIRNLLGRAATAGCLICAPGSVFAEGPLLGSWGVQTKYLSATVSPGDDFYRYVNEGWLESQTLPAGFPRMNSFVEVQLRTEKQIGDLIDGLQEGQQPGAAAAQQVADLYRSYLDEARIEKLGLTPLEQGLATIWAARSRSSVLELMARPLQSMALGVGVELDEKDPTRYVLIVGQGELGLPGREFYLSDEAPFPGLREAYLAYITGQFERAGVARSAARAARVLEFEIALARTHWTPAERRDRRRNYHPMTPAALAEYAPGVDWTAYFAALGVADQKHLVVATDTAVKAGAAAIAGTPLDVLRSWLAFHFINNQATLLPASFRDAHFDFFGRTLNGIAEQRARPLKAQQFVSDNLGEVLGRLYVERYFPPASKAAMEQYIPYLREAFRSHLQSSDWMDDATRREALAKLDAFQAKIGYPDRWRDYGAIEIRADDLIGNYRRIQQWHIDDARARLGEARRDWEWLMAPQTVNAYYSASRNEIVFPAAILQPPFFDPAADPAVNFGAIGAVIGHEMVHGFDDQGSHSDGLGMLRDWWTPASRAAFDARTAVLASQFGAYRPLPDTPISGELTLGENLGDLGGLTMAHTAYRRYLEQQHDGRAPVLDDFTGDQRFFMSWAQVWRSLHTEEFLRRVLLTNPHSPGEYRVNGIVRNMDAWYAAFDVDAEDALYLPPVQRARIW